jgi:hypothetical protein
LQQSQKFRKVEILTLKKRTMNYDIKIRGDKNDNGMLEFDRLNLITQSTKEIATKALMLKIRGFSDIKPDNKLKQALAIRLQSLNGSKTEGTSLLLDCDHFEETIRNLQLNMFKPTEELLKLTPMALVIQTFRSALLDDEDKDNLDKPLLKTLLKFKKNFISDNEVFFFSNRQSIPEIEITKNSCLPIHSNILKKWPWPLLRMPTPRLASWLCKSIKSAPIRRGFFYVETAAVRRMPIIGRMT